MCICICICICIYLSYLSMYLSIYLSIYLPILAWRCAEDAHITEEVPNRSVFQTMMITMVMRRRPHR